MNQAAYSERDQKLMAWQSAKQALDAAKEIELATRLEVVPFIFGEEPREGVNTLDLGGGYKAKATYKLNYTLDRDGDKVEAALEKLEKNGLPAELVERLVKWQPNMSVSEYKQLSDKNRKIIDTVLTIKPGTPSLELVVPKAA